MQNPSYFMSSNKKLPRKGTDTDTVRLKVQLSRVTMTYETKSSGNIIKTLEINDLSQITCYYSSKLIPLSSHRKGR